MFASDSYLFSITVFMLLFLDFRVDLCCELFHYCGYSRLFLLISPAVIRTIAPMTVMHNPVLVRISPIPMLMEYLSCNSGVGS